MNCCLRSATLRTDGNIVPPPSLTVEKRVVGGTDMAVVTVNPADAPPVRCKGRIWIRIGPRRGLASVQDERILNERRRHRDRPLDVQQVPSATLDDLDRRRFADEYLAQAVAADVLAVNDRTDEQRLAASKMVWTARRADSDRARHPRFVSSSPRTSFLAPTSSFCASPGRTSLMRSWTNWSSTERSLMSSAG